MIGRLRLAPTMPTMAPDQRAAVELVLRQGRSYGELSDLLGHARGDDPHPRPRRRVRARARPARPGARRARSSTGCSASRPRPTPRARARCCSRTPPRTAGRRRSRAAARCSRAASASRRSRPRPTRPPRNGKHADRAARKCELRGEPDARSAGPAERRRLTARGRPPRGRSSRLGGALLHRRGGRDRARCAGVRAAARQGRRATRWRPTTRPPPRRPRPRRRCLARRTLVLKGPAGSKSVGADAAARFNDGTVRFALAAQGVEPNKSGEVYSLWLTKKNGDAQLLGDVQQPVTDSRRARLGRAEQRGRRQVPELAPGLRRDRRDARREGRQEARQGHPQGRPAATSDQSGG